MADLMGKIGDYHLLQLLWQGQLASVYLGEHRQYGSRAAIKILHSALADEEAEKFLAQAQITANLDHPHIVRLLDYGIENAIPYLVMQYVPNGSLRQLHPRGSQLPLPTVVSYVRQVASALQYIHDQGLIHCDVKPHNMLLNSRHEVMLSDFGIAVVSQKGGYRRISVSDFEGTVPYAAPEQIRGRPRVASDQYALGVVAYEWITGNWPFSGSVDEIASQHVLNPPPPPREKLPTVAPAVEQVILKALEKDPAQRFESVHAFAIALERASRLEAPQNSVIPGSPLPFTLPSKRALSSTSPAPSLTYRGHSDHVYALVWSPNSLNGPYIASSGLDETIQLWHAYTGQTLVTHHTNALKGQALAWSPDGKYITSTAGLLCETIQTWQISTGQNTAAYPPCNGHSEPINALVWSPDGSKVASASDDGTAQVWEVRSGRSILSYRTHAMGVKAVAWSPNGSYLASAGEDKTVHIWNATTGRNLLIYYGHRDKVNAVAFSPDGSKVASASDDGTVQVWDASSGRKILSYSGHNSFVTVLAWSPDGGKIASGGLDDTVQIWDASNGTSLLTYTGHTDWISTLAWSPNGSHIASGSWDKTVQVWKAK
ncbi:MAG TPA: serine/threonine-protein kinase [Ktedonobacteraceae bacterium]|nr:serine/threonine-protein kinase [Ktedonobacteraceae bacterium]